MTVIEAYAAIHEIRDAQLYGADFVARLGPFRVAVACNGCGPESWPEEDRRKLDKWLAIFRLAFDVHDCRFTYDNDGRWVKFHCANDELERNCLKLADRRYGWYNPMRYWARSRARAIALLCDICGWSAWTEAFAKKEPQGQDFSPPGGE